MTISGLSSVTHFAWFSRVYFKTRIHARIEQFVSFVTHFPISKQIFETEFENLKKKKKKKVFLMSTILFLCTRLYLLSMLYFSLGKPIDSYWFKMSCLTCLIFNCIYCFFLKRWNYIKIFITFLDSTKLKIIWIKITTFFKRRVSIILWSFSS